MLHVHVVIRVNALADWPASKGPRAVRKFRDAMGRLGYNSTVLIEEVPEIKDKA